MPLSRHSSGWYSSRALQEGWLEFSMSIAASSFSSHDNDGMGFLETVDSPKSVRKSSSLSQWDADMSTDNSPSMVCMMS
jgi:hypothetical protein